MTDLLRLFLRLGATAFGGPAAHIAMLHDEVVTRRRWLSEQHFLDLVGATNLIPGPNSTEMMMHIGHERAGWRGLVAAGVAFILPAALIVTALAWAYVNYGATPSGEALLYGVKPVILAIVIQALLKLGKTALKGPLLALAAAGAMALYLLGVNELALLFGIGLGVGALRLAQARRATAALLPWPLLGGLTALRPLAEALPVSMAQLFLVFLKAGALLYGSGYVLLAFLRNDLVVRLGWLTDQQLLDAIAIGQVTPGPVFTTATFVGYVLAGVPGAVVATLGIFLPSFLFVLLLNPLIPRLREVRWTAPLLDGVNAAALGLMGGVTAQLGRAALVDLPTLLLALAAALLLWKTRLNSAWLVVGGAAAGLLLGR